MTHQHIGKGSNMKSVRVRAFSKLKYRYVCRECKYKRAPVRMVTIGKRYR